MWHKLRVLMSTGVTRPLQVTTVDSQQNRSRAWINDNDLSRSE